MARVRIESDVVEPAVGQINETEKVSTVKDAEITKTDETKNVAEKSNDAAEEK